MQKQPSVWVLSDAQNSVCLHTYPFCFQLILCKGFQHKAFGEFDCKDQQMLFGMASKACCVTLHHNTTCSVF